MHKGEGLDCKVLSVMIRHLKILKYFSFGIYLFGPELFTFSWDFIDSDNCKVLTLKSKRLRYSSDYGIQPPGKSIQYK